jgi:hypothetical protein
MSLKRCREREKRPDGNAPRLIGSPGDQNSL